MAPSTPKAVVGAGFARVAAALALGGATKDMAGDRARRECAGSKDGTFDLRERRSPALCPEAELCRESDASGGLVTTDAQRRTLSREMPMLDESLDGLAEARLHDGTDDSYDVDDGGRHRNIVDAAPAFLKGEDVLG